MLEVWSLEFFWHLEASQLESIFCALWGWT